MIRTGRLRHCIVTCLVLLHLLCGVCFSRASTAKKPPPPRIRFTDYDAAVHAAEALLAQEATRVANEDLLREFVSYPTVSKDLSFAEAFPKCADFLVNVLTSRLDLHDARPYESGYEFPVVVGSSKGLESDLPSVVVYGHYDVQPVDGEWTISSPFEMKKIDLEGYGEVYTGRGVQDDKGNTIAALTGIAALHESIDGGLASLPINVIVVLEGEEEIGSKGFGHFLEKNPSVFGKTAVMLCADGSQPRADVGAVQLSNRGSVSGVLDVTGADADLHSGTYGGSILNPLVAMSRILAKLHDPETNKIAVPGFYNDVYELTQEERDELEVVDDKEEAASLGVTHMNGEIGYTTIERKSVRPTLEIVGIRAGFLGEGVKTVLPSTAHAKLSLRLVKGQDPDRAWRMLDDYITQLAPKQAFGCTVKLTKMGEGNKAYTADRNSVGTKVVGEVLDEVYGAKHIVYRMGGSVPVTGFLYETLGVETVTLAFGLDDEQIHAPNERYRLSNLDKGQKSYVRAILKLASALSSPDHLEL